MGFTKEKSGVGRLSLGINKAFRLEKMILGSEPTAGDEDRLRVSAVDGGFRVRRRSAEKNWTLLTEAPTITAVAICPASW